MKLPFFGKKTERGDLKPRQQGAFGPDAGGRAKPLDMSAVMSTTANAQPIRDINIGWYSALSPVVPFAPESSRVRQRNVAPGENMIWQPGSETTPKIGFDILRDFADSLDLFRIAAETVKDRLCAKPWEIRVKRNPDEPKKKWNQRTGSDPRIKQLQAFMNCPDGVHMWPDWARMLVEDMLVIDAPATYLERDTKGKICSLRVIDGGTISRMVTDQGFEPAYPQIAYQQVLYGGPQYNLTVNDLVYKPRNQRTWKRYGYGCVEQIMVTIAIALRRQQFQLKYYTDGNMPEGLCFLPSNVPIDQISNFQAGFDAMLAGDLSQRRRIKFLPSIGEGKSPNIIFPKEVLLKDEMDNWLWQVIAYCLGTRPEGLMKMVNRASAEASADSSEEEGLGPKWDWLCRYVNYIIQVQMGFDDIEFTGKTTQEVDALKQAQIDKIYVSSAIDTINEVRERRGEDPLPQAEANEPGVVAVTGFVPIDINSQVARTTAMTAALPKPEPAAPPPGKQPARKAFDPAEARDENGEWTAGVGGFKAEPKLKIGDRVRRNPKLTARWASAKDPTNTGSIIGYQAGKDNKGKATPGYRFLSDADAKRLKAGDFDEWDHLDRGSWYAASELVPHKKGDFQFDFEKAATIAPELSEGSQRAKAAVQKVLEKVFMSQKEKAKRKATELLKAADFDLAKAKKTPKSVADAIYKAVRPDYDGLPAEMTAQLQTAARAGVAAGIVDLQITSPVFINALNATANAWAEKRAGELVGMKFIGTGWVENPDAQWAISDTTRDNIRDIVTRAFESDTPLPKLVEELQDATAFSEARAEMVANTEVARAQVTSNYEVWKASGVVRSVQWKLSADHPCCDSCDLNADKSVLIGMPFPSGAIMPPDHPNCMCSIIADLVSEN